MDNIFLRPYQNNQIEFIEKKQPGKLPIAISSPTGSGKSYVMLEYVRRRFESIGNTDETIVISTGFNNLVYQIAEEAKKFGLEPILWLGKMHTNCGIKIMERDHLKSFPSLKDYPAFTQDKTMQPPSGSCWKTCEYKKECLYFQALNKFKSFGPKLIITNHSSYIIALKFDFFRPDIAFMDESHTFASFYESFLKTEIKRAEINNILKVLDGRDPTLLLFKRVLEKGLKISPQLFLQIKKKLEFRGNQNYDLIRRLEEVSKATVSIDKYISIGSDGIDITQFWSRFEIEQERIFYVLVSATQDIFTTEMFGVPKQRIYIENAHNTIDYTKSEFVIVPEEKFENGIDKFLALMREEGKQRGLVLSTTMQDVDYLKELKHIHGYKVVTSISQFEKTKVDCILVGSRALFQGIDIYGLNFVALNRIPFPTYDAKYQAMSSYLEHIARMDPWREFTIPKVKNDISQTTGRLWRRPGDVGTIAILDPRLLDKFKYFISFVEEVRKGIKVRVLEDPKEV